MASSIEHRSSTLLNQYANLPDDESSKFHDRIPSLVLHLVLGHWTTHARSSYMANACVLVFVRVLVSIFATGRIPLTNLVSHCSDKAIGQISFGTVLACQYPWCSHHDP